MTVIIEFGEFECSVVRTNSPAPCMHGGWGETVQNFKIDVLTRKHHYISTKYTKLNRIATFEVVCFLSFSDFGTIFQVSVIRDQGTGFRVQGTGNCELKLKTVYCELKTGHLERKNGNWELIMRLGTSNNGSMINEQ